MKEVGRDQCLTNRAPCLQFHRCSSVKFNEVAGSRWPRRIHGNTSVTNLHQNKAVLLRTVQSLSTRQDIKCCDCAMKIHKGKKRQKGDSIWYVFAHTVIGTLTKDALTELIGVKFSKSIFHSSNHIMFL